MDSKLVQPYGGSCYGSQRHHSNEFLVYQENDQIKATTGISTVFYIKGGNTEVIEKDQT